MWEESSSPEGCYFCVRALARSLALLVWFQTHDKVTHDWGLAERDQDSLWLSGNSFPVISKLLMDVPCWTSHPLPQIWPRPQPWFREDGDIMSKVLISSPVAAGFEQLIDSWDFLGSVPLSKSSHYVFHGLTVASHDFPLICAAVTVGPASRHSWWTAQSGLPSPHHHHTELVCPSRGCSPIITFPWHKGRGYKRAPFYRKCHCGMFSRASGAEMW